jgi:hypothetical protein
MANIDKEELIRLRAYSIWFEQGQPEGREREHWDAARREIDGNYRLWRLRPIAEPDDARWLNAPIWKEVVVAAETSGEARFLASQWEAAEVQHNPDSDVAGGTAMAYSSALADPALYDLSEVEGALSDSAGIVGMPERLTGSP